MTIIGIIVLILGALVICVGWSSGRQMKTVGIGVLLALSGGLIGIGANPARDMPNGSPTMVVFGFAGIALSLVLGFVGRKKTAASRQEVKQKAAEAIGATPLDRFFVECVLAGYDDFSLEKNRQRAQLLAQKYGVAYPNGIEALYREGLEAHKIVTERQRQNKLDEKRAEERKEFEALNRYADLTGKDKRIAMLTDRAAELRSKAISQSKYADMLLRSGQQRERDWATWGGVANGIAGFGAGVSTALDIQRQNMEIRAQNEQRLRNAMPAYMFVKNTAGDNSSNAARIEKEIADFKLKLIAETPTDELFRRITFSHTDVLVSETGAAMVCTLASLEEDFKIFDDVPAVVDGTVIAKIYDGDRLCGTAQLVLPLYGVGQDVPLRGICIDCCEPGKEYTAKFAPKNLCALEK